MRGFTSATGMVIGWRGNWPGKDDVKIQLMYNQETRHTCPALQLRPSSGRAATARQSLLASASALRALTPWVVTRDAIDYRGYARQRPEETLLYQVVEEFWPGALALRSAFTQWSLHSLPKGLSIEQATYEESLDRLRASPSRALTFAGW